MTVLSGLTMREAMTRLGFQGEQRINPDYIEQRPIDKVYPDDWHEWPDPCWEAVQLPANPFYLWTFKKVEADEA